MDDEEGSNEEESEEDEESEEEAPPPKMKSKVKMALCVACFIICYAAADDESYC